MADEETVEDEFGKGGPKGNKGLGSEFEKNQQEIARILAAISGEKAPTPSPIPGDPDPTSKGTDTGPQTDFGTIGVSTSPFGPVGGLLSGGNRLLTTFLLCAYARQHA